jgi:carboxyl-terminal processing protease
MLLPLAVLIDGDTASAAEVLAGALKGARPGRAPTLILGQTSYGKGSIQCIIPLEKAPLTHLVGIRLTVARLLSPTGQPYTGRGITPDVASPLLGKQLEDEARKRLLELIAPVMPARPMVIVPETS